MRHIFLTLVTVTAFNAIFFASDNNRLAVTANTKATSIAYSGPIEDDNTSKIRTQDNEKKTESACTTAQAATFLFNEQKEINPIRKRIAEDNSLLDYLNKEALEIAKKILVIKKEIEDEKPTPINAELEEALKNAQEKHTNVNKPIDDTLKRIKYNIELVSLKPRIKK